MSPRRHIRLAILFFPLVLFAALPLWAQNNIEMGKLKIHVSPKQAYVFVDGNAIRDGSQTIDLAAGTHRVGVENYGYVPKIQEVHIGAGETTHLAVSLQSFGDEVSGPFGDIELKGHPRAAVLLDGKTPAYFVGHVDEFDWNWIWHQRLLVHPGTYQLTATREGKTIWSGPVSVKAGEQVTVYLNDNGRTKTKNWREGNTIGPLPRFHAGVASATVPVAPVNAALTARNTSLTCGQSTDLTWSAENAVDTSITSLGEVPSTGNRSLRPPHTMDYQLTAKGPGGEVTKTVAVDVANQPAVTLSLSNVEVHYHKVGDKVVEDDPTTLQWNVSNADKVTITPLGTEVDSGSKLITPKPTEMALGPVNDTIGYTLQASNSCGGTATKTAMLHIVGSIDPAPSIRLASLFYPTDYPTPHHPKVGLVRSEKQTLVKIARNFENYRQYNDKATLLIVGHADVRLSQKYNLALGDRRDSLVRSYLVSQGVPASEIETHSVGKEQQMPLKLVEHLQSQDPQKPEKRFERSNRDTWLAYNRRVDVILEPSGQKPVVAYPNDASDAAVLWEPAQPALKKVESAAKSPGPSGALHAGLTQD
jgi:hypothetical protein